MTSQILPGERAATVTVVTRRLETTPGVLFLCIHNSGRSQMAAGWFRHLAGDAVRVLSAGSEPGEAVNPAAVAVMAEIGIDIEVRVRSLLDEILDREVAD